MDSILQTIHSPRDLDSLSAEQLPRLAQEIRDRIVSVVSKTGGHLASNLGDVELTLALHKVFHAPEDKILWDVGHQSYAHKLLTGRNDSFDFLRQFGGPCGFTRRDESIYDCFGAGHAGTSISAAMGFAAARDYADGKEHVVAVIGDGSLICGIPLEAMNDLRKTCKNLIIILNDNKMSISANVGAIPEYLNRIITGRNYNRFKQGAKRMLGHMPGGRTLVSNIQNLETAAKSFFLPGIFFEEMGIRYIGPINGHNLDSLIQTLSRVKEFPHPVLVHVCTEKGRGCRYAEQAPERFHGVGRFDPVSGNPVPSGNTLSGTTFSAAFAEELDHLHRRDPKIMTVTAAMAYGCGITQDFIERNQGRFFDAGIAEEHAVVFAAGLAAAGYRPIVAIYATFLQRALDCIYHDVCLQNLPVVFCEDRAGIVEDGPTHHGIYDVAFLRSLPNLMILEPADERELALMMEFAVAAGKPAAIRYPRGGSGMPPDRQTHAPVEMGKSILIRDGDDLTIFAAGREVTTAWKVADLLAQSTGLRAGVVNVRFLKPFDRAMLLERAKSGPVVTIEDHVKTGGLSSIVRECLSEAGFAATVTSFGWDADTVIPHGSISKLRETFCMTPEQIVRKLADLR